VEARLRPPGATDSEEFAHEMNEINERPKVEGNF